MGHSRGVPHSFTVFAVCSKSLYLIAEQPFLLQNATDNCLMVHQFQGNFIITVADIGILL